MLLTQRRDVVASYLQLGAEPELAGRLRCLPPHLCATIAEGARRCDEERDFTGLPDGSLCTFEHSSRAVPPLVVPGELPESTLARVGLRGFEVVSVRGRRSSLLEAAIQLAHRAPAEVAATIASSLGMVCWLRRANSEVNQLSSTSFYEFPHCAFVTDLATRHVAPNVVFPTSSAYALLDNLYHEALHQQLIVTMRGVPLLEPSAAGATVDVPWRQERWQVEHALHSLLVYRRLAELRCSMLPVVGEHQVLEAASLDAENCAVVLKRSLLERPDVFTPQGSSFCSSL